MKRTLACWFLSIFTTLLESIGHFGWGLTTTLASFSPGRLQTFFLLSWADSSFFQLYTRLKAERLLFAKEQEPEKCLGDPKTRLTALTLCLKGLSLARERVPILTWKLTMFFFKDFDKTLQMCTRGFVFYDWSRENDIAVFILGVKIEKP